MCGTCGCDLATAVDHDRHHDVPHEHVDASGRRFTHAHARPPIGDRVTVDLETRLLAKNDALAAQSRAWFHAHGIVALNLVSSPGSGKTTLLVRTINDLHDSHPFYVIEGDQETSRDAELIRETGAPAVQLNTGTGCHLDAAMIERALAELAPRERSFVLIENVGNLVCPALFDLGERAKVVVASVTEGDDKPLKYPHMFRAASLVLLGKIDLLAHVPFDVARFTANLSRVNPGAALIPLSAMRGDGLDGWYGWLRAQLPS